LEFRDISRVSEAITLQLNEWR